MKVFLLNPPTYSREQFIREGRCQQRLASFQYVMTPITLPSIAALLRQKGHSVCLHDAMAMNTSVADVLETIQKESPQLLIAVSSTVTLQNDQQVLNAIKKAFPSIFLALSGTHATSLSCEVMQECPSDAIIRNEPEMTALQLADALERKTPLSEVAGLTFRQNAQIIENEARPYLDNLDELPFPARDLLPLERYRLPTLNEPYTLLIPSRGCPYLCTFCTAHQYYGRKIRLRSPENVADEMEEIFTVHQIRQVHMWSDTFTISRRFVWQFCEEMIRRELPMKWMCNARVDTVDLELLKKMKEAGCTGVAYGVESGVQEILDRCKKDITLEQIRQAFQATKEAGIDSLAHVIFGLPGETEKTLRQSLQFVLDLDPTYAQFYCAIPFPGTELREEALKNGWISDFDWAQHEINKSVLETPDLSGPQLLRWKRRAYQRFYFRPKYLLRQVNRYLRSPTELLNKSKQFVFFMKDWART